MAQTIREIYDSLLAEKATMTSLTSLSGVNNSQELLTQLNSTSKVSIWNLMLWVSAFASWLVQQYHDQHKVEVSAILASHRPGTTPWYAQISQEFQYGDTLVKLPITGYEEEFNDPDESKRIFRLGYATINPAAMVVTHAASTEAQGSVRIKVAKGSPGSLAPLSVGEIDALRAYLKLMKYAGTQIKVTSTTADLLKLSIRIVYDPILVNPDGTLKSDNATRPVDVAIVDYIQNLPFNGEFVITHLEDAIQAAIGVVDVEIDSAESKYGILPYSAIDLKVRPDAGYMSIDPAYPLTTVVTYSPQ